MGLNKLVVFTAVHKDFDVEIKGVYDCDFFENPQAIKYYDENHELKSEFPNNPYDVGSKEYTAFEELKEGLASDEDLTWYLSDCEIWKEEAHRKNYILYMEGLTW